MAQKVAVRQVHSDTRFPQRKRSNKHTVPVLEPTSADKLIAGIWRQLHSSVRLSRLDSVRTLCGLDGKFLYYLCFLWLKNRTAH